MVVQVMSRFVVEGHQHIYYERSSSTLESGVDSEESVVGGIQCHHLRESMERIVYCPAPGLTSPSATSYAVATKGLQQMLVAEEGEGGFPEMVEVFPTCRVTWSATWEAGEALKVSVCPLRSRIEG